MAESDAIGSLRRQLEAEPDDPYLLLNLAGYLRRQGGEAALAEHGQILLRVCGIYADAGKVNKARACLEQLLRVDPGNRRALRRLRAMEER